MSQVVSRSLRCPSCNQSQETLVYSSINVPNDPEFRERLFAGKVNVFQCEACGKKAMLYNPLLYHDMQRQFCVQYFPVENLKNQDFFKQFTQLGFPSLNENMEKMMNRLGNRYLAEPHIVFDMDEMLRYIIFREVLFEQGANFRNKQMS